MEFYDVIYSRRSIRKFKQERIGNDVLLKLVDTARFSPSSANLQPLRYAIINDSETARKVFALTKWAGYEPKAGPLDGETPSAYIVVLGDTAASEKVLQNDSGIAMGTICLAATAEGLGSCILGAIDRTSLAKLIDIENKYKVLYLIALGYPAQESNAVKMIDGNCKYYLDRDTLCVPKRDLDDVIIMKTGE